MKNKARLTGLSIIILCFTLLSACGESAAPSPGDKPIVAVSIVPEETFVKAVCGDLVETLVVIPPGFSPENYEPTPAEMQALSKAAVYFSIGVPAEAVSILPTISDNTKIVPLHERCGAEYEDIKIGENRDPHVWLSPKRAIVMVQAVADEMSALDPENSQVYKENAKDYITQLVAVDGEVRAALEGVKNRKFIVFHPAFGYLAADYNLEMYALEAQGKEATAKHLAEMVDLAKAENIKVIFYQAEIDSSQSRAFAEEIGGKTTQFEPLSANYIENLKLMAKTMAEAMN